eukprot:12404724-Karenia_brevis.AAC.1
MTARGPAWGRNTSGIHRPGAHLHCEPLPLAVWTQNLVTSANAACYEDDDDADDEDDGDDGDDGKDDDDDDDDGDSD